MRPATRQVPRMIADLQNEKGSATAPTVPSHGSNISSEETKMNDVTNTTAAAETPARPVKLQMIDIEDLTFTVARLIDALDMAIGDIADGRQRDAMRAFSDVIVSRMGDLKCQIEAAREALA